MRQGVVRFRGEGSGNGPAAGCTGPCGTYQLVDSRQTQFSMPILVNGQKRNNATPWISSYGTSPLLPSSRWYRESLELERLSPSTNTLPSVTVTEKGAVAWIHAGLKISAFINGFAVDRDGLPGSLAGDGIAGQTDDTFD